MSHDVPVVPAYISSHSDEALKQKAYYNSQRMQEFTGLIIDEMNKNDDSKRVSIDDKIKNRNKLDKQLDIEFRNRFALEVIYLPTELVRRTHSDGFCISDFTNGPGTYGDIMPAALNLEGLAGKLP